MTAPDQDPVRAFRSALMPAARHHLDMSPHAIALIRSASEHVSPASLAAICSAGIGWHNPINAPSVILFRLRRESRINEEEAP